MRLGPARSAMFIPMPDASVAHLWLFVPVAARLGGSVKTDPRTVPGVDIRTGPPLGAPDGRSDVARPGRACDLGTLPARRQVAVAERVCRSGQDGHPECHQANTSQPDYDPSQLKHGRDHEFARLSSALPSRSPVLVIDAVPGVHHSPLIVRCLGGQCRNDSSRHPQRACDCRRDAKAGQIIDRCFADEQVPDGRFD